MKKENWKKEEETFLKENYPIYGVKHCCECLNKSKLSIIRKVERLKLKRQFNYRYEKESLQKIVQESKSYSEVARKLNITTNYGNRQTIKKYIELYKLDVSHFDFGLSNNQIIRKRWKTQEMLTKNSLYTSTTNLKNRLYKEGLKKRLCELCGQGEYWQGKKMSLILDHINGVNNDNRLENLRIVCPNCNATLDTHCGKNTKDEQKPKSAMTFKEKKRNFCECGKEIELKAKRCEECGHKFQRKVNRPSYKQLLKEIKESNYCAVGRKYGVSDNAIRKWIRNYEKN